MNEIQKKDDTPAVVKLVKEYRTQIEQSLPKHMTGDRMIRVVLNEFRRQPKLLQCVPESVIGAIVQSSQLGLEIGGVLGHAYLVPFGKECQYVPGYKGLAELMMRSGRVKGVWLHAVLKGDKFFHGIRNGEESLEWEPNYDIDRTDDKLATHFISMVRLDNGSMVWDVMGRGEVERVKAKRKNKYSDVWDEHFIEMAKKTVFRRHAKTLPMSPEIAAALEADNAEFEGESQRNYYDVTKGIIDVDHEIKAPEHEPAKINQEQAAAAFDPKAKEEKAKAEKNAAIVEFHEAVKAMRKIGKDPEAYMKRSITDILKESASIIFAQADHINEYVKAVEDAQKGLVK